jgi:hypothetical protein
VGREVDHHLPRKRFVIVPEVARAALWQIKQNVTFEPRWALEWGGWFLTKNTAASIARTQRHDCISQVDTIAWADWPAGQHSVDHLNGQIWLAAVEGPSL